MELVNLSLILTGVGIFFMLLAILKTRNILGLLNDKKEIDSWRILFFIMLLFIVGYAASFYFILQEQQKFLIELTGMVFLFGATFIFIGAIFVFIVTKISFLTINDLILKDKSVELNIELKKNEVLIKQKSEALEHANKELEDERNELEEKIDQRTFDLTDANIKLKNEIEEHKKAEQELAENKNRLQKQNKALHIVTKCLKIENDNLSKSIPEIIKIASETMESERVSLWLYDETKSSINCIDLYENNKKTHTNGAVLSAKNYPAYFKALQLNRVIDANDANKDPRTFEYSDTYLKPLGITSMLDAPIREAGEMIGIICFEHVGPQRIWTIDEQLFAGAIADSISILLESIDRIKAEKALAEKEKQLSSIYDTVGDAIFHLSIEKEGRYKYVSVNKSFQTITGIDSKNVLWKYVDEIIPQPSLNMVLEKYKKAILEKKIIRWEEISNYPTGQLTGEVSVAPIFDKNGNCTFLVGSVHDITDRKKVEDKIQKLNEELEEKVKERTSVLLKTQESLQLSEEKYRKIVEEAGDCVYSSDYNGYFTYINPVCQKITGYIVNEFVGKNFLDIIAPDWKGKVAIFYKEQFDNRIKETSFIFPIITKSGEEKWVEQIVTQQTEGNKITGHYAIVRDITERKKSEKELNKKSEELVRSNQELEQFAYVASHDLQAPLRMVTSYLQLLEKRYKDKLDKDAQDFINFAVDGSNRMRSLIASLLDYSRINRVKPFEDINLNELLKEVLGDLKTDIATNKAVITIEILPDIFGDKVLIGQLFQNLISNAVKFKGERNPEILISGKKNKGEYLFFVKDNGIGIQKEYASKLFVIFQRLNTEEQYPGTGIGLAICKKIVERHGGKIWFESEFGKGTTFYFTIKGKQELLQEQAKV